MNQQQRTVLYHCGLFSGIAPEQVDAILTAWKAYAGGESHVVQ